MEIETVIRELRKLNQPVPKPLRLPTEREVDAAQRAVGVTFHPDYRTYLLAASDVVFGALEPATVLPGRGNRYLPQMAGSAWRDVGLPRDLLPICEDNGDYYCMTPDGRVVFWSHDGPIASETWPDLATWIEKVWIEESLAT
jgi:hypothetical protein